MKRKVIIISASIAVLALIVSLGIYAQSGQKSNATSEQTQNIPDKCKDCPSKAKCFDGKDKTAAACESKCEGKKSCADASKCEGKKSCADASKCEGKKECGDASKCEGMKAETKGCPAASGCTKSCEKKSN